MARIILDCDLMKHRDSGLYHYCLNLGNYVTKELENDPEDSLYYYVPATEKETFGNKQLSITEKRWHHRFFRPFLLNCGVWHAPFQSGRILPYNNPRIKVLLTIHDLNCLHEDKTARERRNSLQHTQRLVDRANAIVCISHHCKKDVTENIETGNKPLYVIHNGTHQVGIPPQSPAGYKPALPFLFTMGYVNRKKNFHTLLPLLAENHMELLIAGKLDEPDYISNMKKEANRLGVQDRLKILGPVSETDKAWYFSNCMAFALPSLAEGFGAPVVEAMAFGKPVFLSALTSLPEIGGDVSFYFRTFDAGHMQQVFAEGLAQYSKNGLADKIIKRGNEFSWREKAAEYVKLYRSLKG
jgi:glycosyltransferase involved in cell wall biosynthesis